MKLFIDFETRSELDLKDVGAHRYCMDASTGVLLVAYAFDDEPVRVYEALPDHVYEAILDPNVLKVAHNAEFDMAVCKYVLDIDITYDDWFDTAYQAAYYGYPRALGHLTHILKTTAKTSKDEMKMFTSPLPVKTKKGTSADVAEYNRLLQLFPQRWNDATTHPTEWQRFCDYAATDVTAMRECYKKMNTLPEIELFAMRETFEINFNGVPFDSELANKIYARSQEYSQRAGKEAFEKYGIVNLRSVPQVKAALERENVYLDSLNKKERGGEEHEILVLRDMASGAAFSKIPKAFARLCRDGRLRGEFVGFGAHTGRWSSRGVQLQNWARILSDVDTDLSNVRDYDHLRQHIRLCLGYDKWNVFTCADLSQIEARIVAWLANCKWRIEAFNAGEDIYARSAERMFGKKNVTKGDIERQYGKCAELGFGYGGGSNAIRNIQPDFYESIGESKVLQLVQTWRDANPEICKLWRTLERSFKAAVRTGRCEMAIGATILKFVFDGKNAAIHLPSGRALYYRTVRLVPNNYGETLYYSDYSRGGEQPVHVKFWGGTLLENIVQALARDVLVDIMKRVKEREPRSHCVGTVHDELWYLNAPNVNILDILLDEMRRPIRWARGLVTNGDGFTSDRYRK